MIVCQYHGGGVMTQCRFEDFTRMHFGAVDAAQRDDFLFYQAMLVIQIQHHKDFTLQATEFQHQPAFGVLRGFELSRIFSYPFFQQAQRHLDNTLLSGRNAACQ
nr:hypothetical protein PB20LOC_04388 [Pectobacterium parmentieri]